MSSLGVIQHAPPTTPFRFRESASAATRVSGKSLSGQIQDIWRLNRAFGGLSPREYYYFGLYDDARFDESEKRRFIGFGVQQQILWNCTDQQWWATSRDKLVFAALMTSNGFPVPTLQALLHPYRIARNARQLRSLGEAANFLRNDAAYPLFSKPVRGIRSGGSARIDGYDAYTDELSLFPDQRVRVDVYLESIARYIEHGYLFQDVLHPHEAIRRVCGDRLATVRVVMIVGADGPVAFRAMWKVPVGPNVADNFWREGNILCGLDITSGRVLRAVCRTGTDQTEVAVHPETNERIVGLVIPHWDTLMSMCRDVSCVVPGISLQGWDVCVTDDGPVLVEMNIGGDFTLPQLGHAKGMLDDRFQEYLDACGYRPSRSSFGIEILQSLRRRSTASRQQPQLAL